MSTQPSSWQWYKSYVTVQSIKNVYNEIQKMTAQNHVLRNCYMDVIFWVEVDIMHVILKDPSDGYETFLSVAQKK